MCTSNGAGGCEVPRITTPELPWGPSLELTQVVTAHTLLHLHKPPHTMPQTHDMHKANSKHGAWDLAPEASSLSSISRTKNFPEVHGSSGWGLGPGQSGSLLGLQRILITCWECLSLARFVHQLFPMHSIKDIAGSCAWGGDHEVWDAADRSSRGRMASNRKK